MADVAARLAPGVVGGLTARGFGFVSGDVELEIETRGSSGGEPQLEREVAALRALAAGRLRPLCELLGATEREGRELSERLRSAGVLRSPEPAASEGGAIGRALVDAIVREASERVVWTADEALVLPAGVDAAGRRMLLRAFVAGLASALRLELYATAALAAAATVVGDRPAVGDLALVAQALPVLDPAAVHVLDFGRGTWESLAPECVLSPGLESGRLRIVTAPPATAAAGARLHAASARFACPDLAFAAQHATRVAHGIAETAARAQTIAAAEAVERYCCGDSSRHELLRATVAELDDAVAPDSLIAFAPDQYARDPALRPFDPATAILWVEGRTWVGAPRHVPADLVFTPFRDPLLRTTLGYATTSGAAAAPEWEVAARRALLELVERDSFMWHWLQRVERERIAHDSLPQPLRGRVAAVEREGLDVRLVNLTLDTKPVVLCALLASEGHGTGLGAADAPALAAVRAFTEALAGFTYDRDMIVPGPRDVRLPLEHRSAYGSPQRRALASFLWDGADLVELDEIRSADAPVEQAVAAIGEPVLVTLAPPAAGTLTVVKALIPHMLPITFGYDGEPRAMARALRSLEGLDGRSHGTHHELVDRPPNMPHPFT